MRPLSHAECPIRLPMRKRSQGLLKKEKKGKKEGQGGIYGEVERGCNEERGEWKKKDGESERKE